MLASERERESNSLLGEINRWIDIQMRRRITSGVAKQTLSLPFVSLTFFTSTQRPYFSLSSRKRKTRTERRYFCSYLSLDQCVISPFLSLIRVCGNEISDV